MRILQINKYHYLKGGAETVFFNTMSLLKQHGHTVIPFCLKNKKNLYSEYESYFVDYPELSESTLATKIKNIPTFLYNKRAADQLEKLIINEKPELAHIHLMFNSLSVSILPVLRRHNIPTIMTVHDYRLICPAYTFRNSNGDICEKCKCGLYLNCIFSKCSNGNIPNSILLSMDSYFRSFFYKPIDYIDKFIFVSKFSLQKHIETDISYKMKSTHLYNFTPIETKKTDEKKDYLLYFGRISYEKGIQTLIDAMTELPRISLKIVGTGPLLKTIQHKPSNVMFEGFKQGEDLKTYIRNAKFVIVPSEWYENNPLAVIESMAIGTPVIGSNIGGIPELIQDSVTGYLYQSKSKNDLITTIKKAYTLNNDEYKKMTTLGKEFSDLNFSPDAHYKKLINIYQLLLSPII